MITYAVDFESYYDGDCSITTLGPRGYFSHPLFDAYMVTVVGDDGFVYAGCPREFDWSILTDHAVLSHNAAFDQSLYLYGVEVGWFKPCSPAEWHCTADMTAFLGLPRSLKNASATVFGLEVNKTTRDNMKGKQWGAMTDDFKKEVTEYAVKDSELCLRLWQELSDKWPQVERDISYLNRRVGQRGIPIDTELLKKNLENIRTELFNAEQSIPWISEHTPLSRKAFNEQCRKQGIEPPASIAAGNEDADKWFAAFQDACPWARGVQNYRRINAFLRKLEAFDSGTMPDGRYYGGLMYCGANPTARFSGSGGNLNLQNLPRDEMFGVNFRHMIRPKEGYKLVVVDLSQIEVRTLCWLAEDRKALDLIRDSDDIYHAFGVLLGLHNPDNGPLKEYDKQLRHKVKSIALGCGYGMGATKFSTFSGMPIEEAEKAVKLYRDRMPTVPKFWRSLDQNMATACAVGEPFELELPSGRSLRYGKIKRMKEVGSVNRFRHIGKIVRNGQLRDFPLWGGILCENCLSHDTEVLTFDKGWVAISSVSKNQKVWDGLEFVEHSGFIDKGEQEVVKLYGIEATPDHNFLTSGGWLTAEKACTLTLEEVSSPPYEAQGLYANDIWDLHCLKESGEYCREDTIKARDENSLGVRMPVWSKSHPHLERTKTSSNLWSWVPNPLWKNIKSEENTRSIRPQAIRCVALDVRSVSSSVASGLAQLRETWDYCVSEVARVFSELLGRHVPELVGGFNFRPNRQLSRVQSPELQVGYIPTADEKYKEDSDTRRGATATKQKWCEADDVLLSNEPRVAFTSGSNSKGRLRKKVGDLLDCGPRNRFAVRANAKAPVLIAHNCSQGLARDIFSDMMLRVDAAGFPVILHVHDEMVCEVPEAQAEEALAKILEIMHTPPQWIPDIPVAAEGHVLDYYTK